ncbi:uncharacterized protein MONBRDRAFT_29480 [Monosiga brevicollis MX1]|uniref:Serine/threonine-protein phosphatase n=1 Tax=Monosiga brevicollis TaxID=81824 RepID=A9VB78_MONBE|nr:uncharacterized protein MONBRDRAFT_29480 [Monosiga brevicollis MX1]EDQ85139.1 predicted protein [Monosiga brevicollis MX1]|eukprot:XP_001749964.1 hypothetical protein [Monosiga brevicollis MX1]
MAKRPDLSERQISWVPAPASRILDEEDIFDENGIPLVNVLCQHFKREGRLTDRAAIRILDDVADVMRKEPNVLQVPAPVVIVGDIHGQFYDLMKVFSVGGDPATTKYLFLGDYVDRGYFSLECVLYIWSLKLKYPGNFWLLRGNHECRHLTEFFTFQTEVGYKNSLSVYDACMNSFDCLPIAAIMNKQFFCVHGGISPEVSKVEDINSLDRFNEPDESGALCDLLWADPHDRFDEDLGDTAFQHNETRGCSYYYTHKAVCSFLERNELLSVIRAHEAQDAGYRMYKPNPSTGFPSVITLFSAPNYLDVYGNKAAVMIYANNSMNIKKFSASEHPYWLPNFMDVFTWSLPFIGEKTTEMLEHLMNVCSAEELAQTNTEVDELADKMKKAMSRVKTRRQSYSEVNELNRKALSMAGAASPTGEAPSEEVIETAKQTFEGVRSLDRANESRPRRDSVNKARVFRRRQTLEQVE